MFEENKKAFHISKNILAITLTVCMLLVFGFSEYHLTHASAQDNDLEELETQVVEETGTEAEVVTEESDTEQGTESLLPDTSDQGDIGIQGGEEPKESEETEEPEKDSDTETEEEEQEEKAVLVARLIYSYVFERPMTPEEVENQTVETASLSTEELENQELEEASLTTEEPEEQVEEEIPMVEETRSFSDDYESLEQAFEEVDSALELIESVNAKEYSVTIQLLEDITLSACFENRENASVTFDFNGHKIILLEDIYMDFGQGELLFTDTQFLEADTVSQGILANSEEQEPVVLGGLEGNANALLLTEGKLTFETGYYENTREGASLIEGQAQIVFLNGYFISSKGSVAVLANQCQVLGGFYIYDIVKGFCENGLLLCPEEKALVKKQVQIGELSMVGYMLGDPSYMVEAGELETFHADFADAWDTACYLSVRFGGQETTISLVSEAAKGIRVSQSYVLQQGLDENGEPVFPRVVIDHFQMKRELGYTGNFITVNQGCLLLKDCYLDGAVVYASEEEKQADMQKPAEEWQKSQASMVAVMEQGMLILQDSSVCNNYATPASGSTDPCAGISLQENASIKLLGIVQVKDNYRCIKRLEEDGTEETVVSECNLYEAVQNQIILSGPLREPERVSYIGVTIGSGAIAGLSIIGSLEKDYLNALQAGLEPTEELDLSDTMELLHADGNPSFYPVYAAASGSFFWDCTTYNLPEAGELRFEFLLLTFGLLLFVLTTIPAVKRKRITSVLLFVFGICFVVCGASVGLFRILNHEEVVERNTLIITDLASTVDAPVVSSSAATPAKQLPHEEGTEDKEEENILLPQDGRSYLGVLEIEDLGIKLPILSEYSDANMKRNPCVYYGTIADNNLVIVGHNYDTQLAQLNDLPENPGITVTLYTKDNPEQVYEGFLVENLNPDQVDEMLQGQWDLTIFTCNYTGDKRIALRCRRK